MIAIQSNKQLQFPPANVGYVRMEIDLIQNKPNEGVYELRIIDTCFEKIITQKLKPSYVPQYTTDEPPILIEPLPTDYEDIETEKVLEKHTRFKKYGYEDLKQLAQSLNIDFSDTLLTVENINSLFREGLLLVTQGECQAGISGVGKGMYFSEVTDWELVE